MTRVGHRGEIDLGLASEVDPLIKSGALCPFRSFPILRQTTLKGLKRLE